MSFMINGKVRIVTYGYRLEANYVFCMKGQLNSTVTNRIKVDYDH